MRNEIIDEIVSVLQRIDGIKTVKRNLWDVADSQLPAVAVVYKGESPKDLLNRTQINMQVELKLLTKERDSDSNLVSLIEEIEKAFDVYQNSNFYAVVGSITSDAGAIYPYRRADITLNVIFRRY
jgi:hypothetical protein